MYRQFATDYYDPNTGPHRVKLLEHDLELSNSQWWVRALLKLGLVIAPILIIGAAIGLLQTIS